MPRRILGHFSGGNRATRPEESAKPATPERWSVSDLVDRRTSVSDWLRGKETARPQHMTGLAIAGGGIRSATFSLGLIQALAKSDRDALSNVDILSSVSGGGYIACFLRSLFMPDEGRGISPQGAPGPIQDEVTLDFDNVKDQFEFAREVLASEAILKTITWPLSGGIKRRNPLWWLREHSRYLAPNGPTDYGYAIAYLARNWLAMLFIFVLASLAIASTVTLAEAAFPLLKPYFAQHGLSLPEWRGWIDLPRGAPTSASCGGYCTRPPQRMLPVSPIFLLVPVPLLIGTMLSIAYWMTQAMSSNEPSLKRQWGNLLMAVGATMAAVILIALAAWADRHQLGGWGLDDAALTRFVLVAAVGLVLATGAAIAALIWAWSASSGDSLLTAELRRKLTQSVATSNWFLMLFIAAALLDSAGAGLAYSLRWGGSGTLGATWVVLTPVFAFVMRKIPDWFGGAGKSDMGSLVGRYLSPIALLAGLALYGMLVLAAVAMVHRVAWSGPAWLAAPDWPRLLLFVFIVWIIALLVGRATGVINLSSLHLLYASRLTRAYLGASNNARLKAAAKPGSGSGIKDNHPDDYIQPWVYSRANLPAPIHILNATINETIDPQSQIVSRDRKGDIISLEPQGINVGTEMVAWEKIGARSCAEHISLGQWCAISGAAASSGMGRLTNLGFALALTFANVRLGYWWWSPGFSSHAEPRWITRVFVRLFGSFVYLCNEMTARYSRAYVRKYLTDGGHFENTGAYRLIERKIPLIVLSDNGADPRYQFEDLEILVRKVRLDLDGEVAILQGIDLENFLATLGGTDPSIFVNPQADAGWRETFAQGGPGPFVLALEAKFKGETIHILWIKPRLLPRLPADVAGYSGSHPDFPQQTTANQFFDEAQWESYRKLGEISMDRLLKACPGLLTRAPPGPKSDSEATA